MAKDFFNVVEASRDHKGFREAVLEEISLETYDRKTRTHFKVLLHQLDIQLAIAQQLTMIAQHLGEIVSKSKNEPTV